MKQSGISALAGRSNETSRLGGRTYTFGKPVVPGGRILVALMVVKSRAFRAKNSARCPILD